LIGLILLGLGLTMPGCRPEPQVPPRQVPQVTVARPVVRDVNQFGYFTGKTQAINSVDLRARVQGFLEKVNFTDGDPVEKDQLLFVIEQAPFQAKLAAAEAHKQQTTAALKLAEANLARAENLVKTKAISVEEYQSRVAERDAAQAEIAADDAAIEQAKIDLGYTEIRSPIDGRISRHYVDPGNLVGATEKTLLATVLAMDPMYVYFDVSEKVVLDLLRYHREHKGENGKPNAYLQLPGEEDYPHEGKLDYLENQVDPQTGTAIVRGVFPNAEGLLYPGVYAQVKVPGHPIANAVLVEEQALGTNLSGKYLLVVGKDNKVEQRQVELGQKYEGLQHITGGLKPDERYIVTGLQKARPGLPVDPVERKSDK
jgi:RND family efflux transporter MFP subunit